MILVSLYNITDDQLGILLMTDETEKGLAEHSVSTGSTEMRSWVGRSVPKSLGCSFVG